ncbi:hypothetical protein B7463_g11923, partial [Scytalidium lignicola]
MDENTISEQIAMTIALSSCSPHTIKLAGIFPGLMEGEVSLCIFRGREIFDDICLQALRYKSPLAGNSLIEVPFKLVQSKSCLPPIVIDEADLSGTVKEQLSVMGLFCIAQYIVPPIESHYMLPEDLVQIFNNAINTFAWISRRYYEIILFRNLQDAANRLNSLSTDELTQIAGVLLDMLFIGTMEMCKTEDSFAASIGQSYLDKKIRIRRALFIYFSIILDKLPARSDFWKTERNYAKQGALDLSKHPLTVLEAFDWHYRHEVVRSRMFTDLLLKRVDGLESMQSIHEDERHVATSIPVQIRLNTFGELFWGPRKLQLNVEGIIMQLSDIYQPKIE